MNIENILENILNIGFPIFLIATTIFVQYKIKETEKFDYHKQENNH